MGYFGYYNEGSRITDSNASGKVSGGYYSGGLVGYFYGSALGDSSASGNVDGTGYVGGLLGGASAFGNISNVSASGSVGVTGTSASYVGGLVGLIYLYNTGGISNGRASGAVTASGSGATLGGLAGYVSASSNAGVINDSAATGKVTGAGTSGGLIGYFENGGGNSALRNSYATGDVVGSGSVGGLVGLYSRSSTSGRAEDISNSYATGQVSGQNSVGGLVGEFYGRYGIAGSYATGGVTGLGTTSLISLGGLAGYYYTYGSSTGATAPLSTSYASGQVQLADSAVLGNSTTVYAGGLVGQLTGSQVADGIVDAYATGAVTLSNLRGRLHAGGLVGYTNNQNVQRAYATGAVSATGGTLRATGGLLALRNTGNVSASYWDSTATGQATSVGGGTALSASAMKQGATFDGWDLGSTGTGTTTWRIYEGYTAPLLTRFLTPLTLSLADASKTYDGTLSFGNATLGAGILADRIFTATPSADVGSYSVAAGGVYSVQDGYDLTVVGSATLTVTPRALTLAGVVTDKVYDGTRVATLQSAAQPAGIVAGESLTLNLGSASALFDTKDVGQNKLVSISGVTLADGAGPASGKASNYTLSAGSTTASITPKALNAGGFTATNRTYDGSTTVAVSAAGGAVSGQIGSDDVNVDVAAVTSGTVATKDVGTGKAVSVLGATLSGADAGNYVIGGIDSVTVDITPRSLNVNGLTGSNRSYNQNVNVSVDTGNGILAGAVAGDVVQLRSTTINGTMADRHAGDGKTVNVAGSSLQLRGPDAANYSIANATATVNITPALVYFYADYNGQRDKVYDGGDVAFVQPYANPSFGYTLFTTTTTIGVDELTLSYDTPRYSDKNVAYSGSTVTTKTITVANAVLGGADAGNYVLNNVSATTSGRINPLALNVTGVTATNRAYDGSTNVEVDVGSASVNTTTVIAGDVVSVALPGSGTVVGTVANKNVGNNKPVTVPGFTLSGADAGNYSLSGSGGVTVNITPKSLTASYTALDKVYDGNGYARVNVSSADIVAGDQVRFYADINDYNCYGCYAFFVTDTSTPTSYSLSKDAAAVKRVVVVDNALFGNDAANYTLVNRTATLSASITPKGITPVFTGVNKVYDGSTTATVNVNTSASGILSGDAVSLARTANFDTKNVGSGKTIRITDIAFSGVSAGNYTLATTTATTTAAITPKPLSVQGVTATDRAYDGSTAVALTVGTLSAGGVVDTDLVDLLAPAGGIGNGSMANKNVGTNKPVTVAGLALSGADAANYSIDGSLGVTVNIGQRDLTVAYTGVDRVYNGGVAAVVTASSADLVTGDTLSFNQNAIFTGLDARNVGNNKPVSITGITMTGGDAANYRLLNTSATTTAGITPKAITVSYVGLSRVYNGLADVTASVLGSSTGLVAGDLVTFTQTALFQGDGAAGSGKPVDIINIALTGAQGGNYSLLATTATTSATITPRLLGVTGVLAADRVYDGTRDVVLSTVGATVLPAGVLAGDTVTVLLPSGGITTGTVATKDAGTNKAVTITGLTLSGASAANYSVVGASGVTVNITPRPLTAVYGAASRVYDGSTLATVNGSSTGILGGDVGAVGISASGLFGNKNAGADKAVAVSGGFLTGAERNNYTLLNTTGSALASITPKTLTPAYQGGTRVYDGSTSAPVTALGTGVVTGDTVSFVQTAVFTGANAKDVGSGKGIAISGITLSGLDAANYALVGTTASASGGITPKPISIDGLTGATATNRVYDGTPSVQVVVTTSGTLSPSSADIVAGDSVAINLPSGGITTGTMANKNAGNNKALVVDGLTLTGADAGNYTVAATTGITVDIARKPLTALYAGVDKVYDGGTAASISGNSADVIGSDVVSIGGSGVFTGSGARNVGTGKTVLVLAGLLSGADAANYALVNTSGSTTAGITPRPVSPTYTGLDKVYDGTTAALVSANASGFIAGDAVTLGQTAQFTGDKNVGTNKTIAVSGITLSGTDATNYSLTATSASTTGGITPRPLGIQGLTGVAATNRVYDGTDIVEVIVSSTGPIAPDPADVVAGDDVTVTAPSAGATTGTLLDKHVGTAKPVAVSGLTLGGADAANYSITATSGVTVDITPRPLTAAYSAVTRVYDGTVLASIAGSSVDLIGGDLVTISANGVFTGAGAKNVGSGKAVSVQAGSLSGVDAANYSLLNPTGSTTGSITPRDVSVSYLGGTRVYDGSVAAPVTATTTGLVAGDDIAVGQTAVFTGTGAKNVGNAKPVAISGIALSGSDAGNYLLTGTSTFVTASVTPRPLRIEGFSGIVATDRVYDGSIHVAISVLGSGAIAANSADVVPGDDVVAIAPPTGTSAGTLLNKNVGSNKPVIVNGVTLGGVDAGNYSVAAATGVTVNITPKSLTASYAALDKAYDGTATASIVGSSADVVAGDLVGIGGSGIFVDGRNVGAGKTVSVSSGTLSDADAGNYTLLNPTATLSASITPKTLTASYTGGTRVYDGSVNASVTGALSGLIAGDVVSFGQNAVFIGADARNVGVDKVVEITSITLQGADAANYSLLSSSTVTTATITPRPLSVSGLSGLQAVDRVYDGTRDVQITGAAVVGTAAGDVISGDDVTINLPSGSISAGTMVDKAAGTGKAVAVSGLSLSGADAPNYQITGVAGLSVNIAPRPVVLLGVSAVSRVYDGSTVVAINSAGGSLSGVLAGDDLQLLASGVTGSIADKHVGNGKAVSVTGLSFAGADIANYTVDGGGGLQVDITPRTLVASATAADKIYDGNALAAVTLLDDRIAGDTLAMTSSSATFAGKDAGAGQAVTVAGLALTGTDAGNYLLLANTLTTTASINRAPLTISADSLSKVYGESVNLTGTEFTTLGLVAGESLGLVTLASAATASTAAVTGTPYTIDVSDARSGSFNPANYTLAYTSGLLTVTPRPLTIAANSVVRTADEPNPRDFGFSTSVGGLVVGDSVSSVTLNAPTGSATAPGGSIFELVPSGAVFGAGLASNYAISYDSGLLVVLPRPPRVDDVDPNAGNTGQQGFAVQVDQAELERALDTLQRNASVVAQNGADRAPQLPVALRNIDATAAEISVALAGDSRRITLPALLRLPLISFDPDLRRLMFGRAAAGSGSQPPSSTAP
ncbi:MAG: YDG domain-containing protein [Rubrivivax sp.]|nr:YDG domain-containing protein [Rubrivivax sp.]